jgi:hypothetical protein
MVELLLATKLVNLVVQLTVLVVMGLDSGSANGGTGSEGNSSFMVHENRKEQSAKHDKT